MERTLLVLVFLIASVVGACGKSSDSGSGGSAAGAGANTGGTASGGGDLCADVKICEVFPAAKVDGMCGTATDHVVPVNAPSGDKTWVATCEYATAKNDGILTIGRMCFPAGSGGAGGAKQMFKLMRDDKHGTRVQTEVSGVGDEAMLVTETSHSQAVLNVRKGNLVVMVGSKAVTAGTEAAVTKDCLTPLASALLSK